jgi:arabinose-5-phosphate isomerase
MAAAPQPSHRHSAFEIVRNAKAILTHQSAAIARVADRVPADFAAAVEAVANCQGCVIVTGMGKAGWIGQKISASLASLGTASHFLHPAEAIHGDLGRIRSGDVVLALSNSGETAEIVNLLPRIESFGVSIIAMTSKLDSSLANHASLVLDFGRVDESCHLGLAPSASTTVMLALGDALALSVSQLRAFQATDFVKFHPGGSLGVKLSMVTEMMRPLASCRVASETETVREIYVTHRGEKRRSGVVLLTNELGELSGIFTDSDLAKLLERQQDNQFDGPIADVMTHQPITVASTERTSVAIEILASRNISELPVVDHRNRPQGLIDITDVVSLS